MKQLILFLHGAAERNPQYASALQRRLLEAAISPIECSPIYYGNFMDSLEKPFIHGLQASLQYKREHMKGFRGEINMFVMDALQVAMHRADIEKIVDSKMYRPDVSAIHLVGHSLGAVIFLDYTLKWLKDPKIKSVTTLGCPYHWMDRGTPKTEFPAKLLQKWSNFYHTDDFIGCPLNGLYGCQDMEVKDAGPPTWWLGNTELISGIAAHKCYWKSKIVANHILQKVDKTA